MTNANASPVVATAVERAVVHSFDARPMPAGRVTQAECRRRVKICEGIWWALRLESKWSLQRACDHLYRFLLAEIDGTHWEPDKRSIWTPDTLGQT